MFCESRQNLIYKTAHVCRHEAELLGVQATARRGGLDVTPRSNFQTESDHQSIF